MQSSSGFAGVAGFEYGAGKGQLGLALALPIQGFTFGSIYGSAAAMIEKQIAVRFDIGYDRVVIQEQQVASASASGLLTFGFGVPFEARITHNVSFVSGRVGAMNFAHFVEISQVGLDFYQGAAVPFASADLFAISKAFDGGTRVMVNIPFGILVQVADPLAIVFRSGYQAFIFPDNGAAQHFVPLGFDATLSASRDLDLGASFLLPGYVGGSDITGATYTNAGIIAFWLRFRT